VAEVSDEDNLLALDVRLSNLRQVYVSIAAGQHQAWAFVEQAGDLVWVAAMSATASEESYSDGLEMSFDHAFRTTYMFNNRETLSKTDIQDEIAAIGLVMRALWEDP
jgi:hypothetical protein